MIISFYSYEPNVGGTAAATNVGILLAREFAKKTLIADWTFGLGIPKPLKQICPSPDASLSGIISRYKETLEGDEPLTLDQLRDIVGTANPTSIGRLSYLPALTDDEGRELKYGGFAWQEFYQKHGGGLLVEFLKRHWQEDNDAVIIISERAFSPGAAICTLQVPDVIVILTDSHHIETSARILDRITSPETRKSGGEISILPVLCKFAPSELSLRISATEEMRQTFSRFLPARLDPTRYFDSALIPFLPYYAQSQEIPVIRDPGSELAQSYAHIAENIVSVMNTP